MGRAYAVREKKIKETGAAKVSYILLIQKKYILLQKEEEQNQNLIYH